MKMKMAALCMLSLAACAGYTITPVKLRSDWSANREGYLIYEPKAYLRVSVTQTDKGPVYASDLAYLPNLSRPYRINTWCYFAKADFTFGIQNGWMLQNVASKVDTTDLPKTIVDAAKGFIPSEVGKPKPYVAHYYEVKEADDGKGIMVAKEPSFSVEVPQGATADK